MRNYLQKARHLVLFISFLYFSPEISDARALRGFSSRGMGGGLPTATESMGNFRSFGSSFGSNNNFRHGGQNTMMSSMAGSNYPSGSSMLGARNSIGSRQGGLHNFGGSINGNRQFSGSTTGMRGPQFNTMNTGSVQNFGHTNVRGPVLRPSNLPNTQLNTMNTGLRTNHQLATNHHGRTNIRGPISSRTNFVGSLNSMNPDLGTNYHTNIGSPILRPSSLPGAQMNTVDSSFGTNHQSATNQYGRNNIRGPIATQTSVGGSINTINSVSSINSRNAGSSKELAKGLPQNSNTILCRYRCGGERASRIDPDCYRNLAAKELLKKQGHQGTFHHKHRPKLNGVGFVTQSGDTNDRRVASMYEQNLMNAEAKRPGQGTEPKATQASFIRHPLNANEKPAWMRVGKLRNENTRRQRFQ